MYFQPSAVPMSGNGYLVQLHHEFMIYILRSTSCGITDSQSNCLLIFALHSDIKGFRIRLQTGSIQTAAVIIENASVTFFSDLLDQSVQGTVCFCCLLSFWQGFPLKRIVNVNETNYSKFYFIGMTKFFVFGIELQRKILFIIFCNY